MGRSGRWSGHDGKNRPATAKGLWTIVHVYMCAQSCKYRLTPGSEAVQDIYPKLFTLPPEGGALGG